MAHHPTTHGPSLPHLAEAVASGFSICPACRSQEIEADGHADAEGGIATQEVRCRECKARWLEVYKASEIWPLE